MSMASLVSVLEGASKRSLLEVIEFLLYAVEIEVVANLILVHLAQELVVLQSAEPLDPSSAAFRVIRIVWGGMSILRAGALVFKCGSYLTSLKYSSDRGISCSKRELI